jgi:hypothetical protein
MLTIILEALKGSLLVLGEGHDFTLTKVSTLMHWSLAVSLLLPVQRIVVRDRRRY